MTEVVIEIDDSLGKSHTELFGGLIIQLKSDIVIFISGRKIGIFDNKTMDSVNGDFSKIPTSGIILQIEEEGGEIDEIPSIVH